MKIYTVHEPPKPPADRIDRAERLVFVRDGFDWNGFLFAPFSLLSHRLFVGFASYVAAIVTAVLILASLGADAAWLFTALIALHLIVAFELSEIRRWKMGRQGWTTVGVVAGANQNECERRFFDRWLPGQPMIRPSDHGRPGPTAGSLPTDTLPIRGVEPRGGRLGRIIGRAVGTSDRPRRAEP
jgi:hypothetical protein